MLPFGKCYCMEYQLHLLLINAVVKITRHGGVCVFVVVGGCLVLVHNVNSGKPLGLSVGLLLGLLNRGGRLPIEWVVPLHGVNGKEKINKDQHSFLCFSTRDTIDQPPQAPVSMTSLTSCSKPSNWKPQ